MLRQHLPTLRLTRIRFTRRCLRGFASIGFTSRCTLHRFTIIRHPSRCSRDRFPHPLLMLPALVLAPMRLIHQLFLACLVMRDQLVLAIANQFLPPHLRYRFAQQRPVLGIVPAQEGFVQLALFRRFGGGDLFAFVGDLVQRVLFAVVHGGGGCHR